MEGNGMTKFFLKNFSFCFKKLKFNEKLKNKDTIKTVTIA